MGWSPNALDDQTTPSLKRSADVHLHFKSYQHFRHKIVVAGSWAFTSERRGATTVGSYARLRWALVQLAAP